jgi:hypothetical protein
MITSRRMGWAGHGTRMDTLNILTSRYIYVNTRNWVDFAQDKIFWRVLVNAALNLLVT